MITDSTHGLRHGLAQGQVSRQSRGGPGRRYICVGNRQDYSLRRVERAGGWVARVRVGTPARLSCRKAAQSAELPRHRRVCTATFSPSLPPLPARTASVALTARLSGLYSLPIALLGLPNSLTLHAPGASCQARLYGRLVLSTTRVGPADGDQGQLYDSR